MTSKWMARIFIVFVAVTASRAFAVERIYQCNVQTKTGRNLLTSHYSDKVGSLAQAQHEAIQKCVEDWRVRVDYKTCQNSFYDCLSWLPDGSDLHGEPTPPSI